MKRQGHNVKWLFLDISEREKAILASNETAGYRSRNDHFPDVSVHENVSPERWNGRVPVREVTIFGRLGVWWTVFSLWLNGRFSVSEMTIFPTFRYISVSPERWNGRFPVHEMNIFLAIRRLKKCILATGETAGLPFAKWSFFRRFGTRKMFPPWRRNGCVLVLEMTYFWLFGSWDIVSLPAKRPAYRSQYDHLYRRFGTWKTFPRQWRNGRVPVREVKILGRFRAWVNVASGETVGLPFAKDNFCPRFWTRKKFLPQSQIRLFSFREVTIFGLLEPEEPNSRLQRNGPLTVCEMTILSEPSEPEKRILAPKKRPRSLLWSNHFSKFRILRRNSRFTVRKMSVFSDFAAPEEASSLSMNGREPVREVTVFGHLGAWGTVLDI